MDKETYFIWGAITAVISAIAIWIYSMTQWGLLFGLLFGWIPAVIGGVILGFLWPLVAIALAFVVFLLVK